MKIYALFSLAAALMPTAQALGSERWYFPEASQNTGADSHYFMVDQITLPIQWAIEAWVKPVYPGNFLSYTIPGNQDCFLTIHTNDLTPSQSITQLNTWHHVMVTWDGVNNKIFSNGVEGFLWRDPAFSSACTESPGILKFGPAVQSAEMYLDTVAIYNKAWTDSEITEEGPKTCVDVSDPNLIGLWYDTAGTVSTDHFVNENTAEVVSSGTKTNGDYGTCEDGSCFHANGTVLLESGESKRFSELNIGDVIRTSDGEGAFSFNPVLTLPHAANSEAATFLNLITETGKYVILTPDHFIPKCNFHEVTASELVVGDCLITADGKETLVEVTSAEKNGVYTATTQDKFLVVDGIVASPYSKNSRHAHKAGWDLSSKYGKDLKRGKQRIISYFKNHLRGNA